MLALNISFNFLIDNGIDMEAMELLGVTQIEKLVPLLGPQLKLIKKWKAHVRNSSLQILLCTTNSVYNKTS